MTEPTPELGSHSSDKPAQWWVVITHRAKELSCSKASPVSPIALTGLGGTLSNYNTPTADFSMTKNNLEHQIKIKEEGKLK
jgi:hypothetical protein